MRGGSRRCLREPVRERVLPYIEELPVAGDFQEVEIKVWLTPAGSAECPDHGSVGFRRVCGPPRLITLERYPEQVQRNRLRPAEPRVMPDAQLRIEKCRDCESENESGGKEPPAAADPADAARRLQRWSTCRRVLDFHQQESYRLP